MKITGTKRWILLVVVSIFSGTMVIAFPYLFILLLLCVTLVKEFGKEKGGIE